MSTFQFLHCADLHLDSPLRGLAAYPGAPAGELRGATRRAFEALIDLAIAERVRFVLIAGDVYDGDWPDYNTGLWFAHQLGRLGREGIRAFVVSGNHDAASRITRQLRLPESAFVFPTDHPATVELKDLPVAVHGQGFPRAAVTDDLSRGYPEPSPGRFDIGLLHTCADGREGHERYAPCSVEGLAAKGYSYWALGHVHRREILRRDPWIVFPGNPQGRHARETGEKGCFLVRVVDGEVDDVEFRPADVLRWATLRVDASGARTLEEVVESVESEALAELSRAEGRLVAVRLEIAGRCPAHASLVARGQECEAEIRARLSEEGRGRVWVEKVRIGTDSSRDSSRPEGEADALADVARWLRELAADEDLLDAAREQTRELAKKLPAELNRGPEALDLESERAWGERLEEVKRLLAPRLLEREGRG